ncbi:MAG: copper resistance CopC family protein [Pseudolysinimonas sp.]|uniref:copper resistance CopC family protein n=1 Tax=Pseudolysinimonas sp. TaxID=2680009 RepID=UPI003C77AE9C
MNVPSARPRRRTIVGVALVIGLVLAVPAPAAAHEGLVSSSPAAGSTVIAPPETVSLGFSDELLDIGDSNGAFAIQVIGPDELFYNRGCVQRQGSTASTATVMGESGTYRVIWQVISADGHPTSDSFDFVYQKPTDEIPTEGAATAPCRPGDSIPPGDGADDAAGRESSEQGGEDLTFTGIWIVGGGLVAFLVLCAIVVAVIGARSRRRHQPFDQRSLDERQPE